MIVFLTAFWQLGLLFGIFMGLFFAFQYGWKEGLLAGAFCGFGFGLLMASFIYLQSRKFKQNRPLESNEKLIHEGTGNYHGNGGWLYLTDSRLLFVSHKVNIKTHELEFPLSEIVSVENGLRLGIIPNNLILNLRNGKREEFTVQNAKNWVNQIKRASHLQIEAPQDLKYL